MTLIRVFSPAEAQQLIRSSNVNERDSQGATALIVLCSYSSNNPNRLQTARILIEHGAEINAAANDGGTALMRACAFHSFEMIKLLLEIGADINIRTPDGRGAMHYVALRRDGERIEEIIDLLIQHGANINDRDNNGNSSLLIALDLDRSHMRFVLYLFSLQAFFYDPSENTNNNNNNNSNVIHGFVSNERYSEKPSNKVTNKGRIEYVLKQTKRLNDFKIMEQMLKFYPPVSNLIFPLAVLCLSDEMIFQLLELKEQYNIDINATDGEMTALCRCCQKRKYSLAKLLLQHGANPSGKLGPNSVTPLHILCGHQYDKQMFDELLKYNPDMDPLLARGIITPAIKTPLHIALENGNQEAVKKLIDGGAKLIDMVEIKENRSVWQVCAWYESWSCWDALAISHSPITHKQFPGYFKDAVICFMMANKRQQWGFDSSILHKIFSFAAINFKEDLPASTSFFKFL